jgi:trimeric autotransporter adhesin
MNLLLFGQRVLVATGLLCCFVGSAQESGHPTARAGAGQTVAVGSAVILNGSASTDPHGDSLTFVWTLVSKPVGSAAELRNATSLISSFIADKPGSYTINLVVNDGTTNSAPDFVIISTSNSAPLANAGPDQTVAIGSTVILNGSASSDVDGNALIYAWSITSRPPGSTAALLNTNDVTPSFIADTAGQYVVQLIVNDGTLYSRPDTLTISTVNSPPAADAGANQTVPETGLVVLNGSGSTDVDGNALTFVWSFVSRPEGSTATLSNPAAVMPTFSADVAGDFVVQLTVNDGIVNSAPRTVTITTTNSAPRANAGPDQTVAVGSVVSLNGRTSSDPESAPLNFRWSLISRPGGSATLSNANSATPSFTADVPGTYVAQLIVNDGRSDSVPDTVIVDTRKVAPKANAGPNRTAGVDATAVLDGSGSFDADGDPLTYFWSFTSRPADSTAALTNPTALSPTFVVDRPGIYVLQLIVNDGTANSDPSTVVIDTQNQAPSAQADADQTTEVGKTKRLDGTGSFDPDGSPLTYAWSVISAPKGSTAKLTNATSATPAITPDVAGTYTIRFVVNDGAIDSAAKSVTLNATVNAGGALGNGSLHTGSIVTAGQVDSWTFTANAGQRIAVHIGEIVDNNDFRPWIRVQAPNASIVGSAFGTDATALSDIVAATTGTYTVLVASADSGFDGTGTYRLTMTKTPGPIAVSPADQGGPLTNGGIHTGQISQGDLDVWTFTAAAGERIAVHIGEITDTDDFRPWIRVWAPNGATLGSAFGTDATAQSDLIAPVTGTYLVLVASADSGFDGTGTYRLTLTKTAGPIVVSDGDQGGPLTNGAIHTGQIIQGDLDVWTFNATAGQRIGVHIGEIADTDDFRPWIRVWAPNNVNLGSAFGTDATALSDIIAPVTGTYLVLVASADSGFDGTGTYRLTMTKTPGPITVSEEDQGGPLTNGALHAGEIVQGDLDVWTFVATAGQRIAVHIGEVTDTDDFRPWIRVWAPNGATLGAAFGTDATALSDLIAPVTGNYLVLVASADSGFDGTGTYRLTMTKTPGPITVSPGDQGGALPNGGRRTGEILQGDLDVWRFSATVGQRIAVHIGEIADNDDFRPWIRIWAPNGATLGAAFGTDAAALSDLIAPVTGTYLVLVASADSGFDGTGTYRLSMTKTPGPIVVPDGDQGGPLTNGGTHTGQINQGDLDVWTFNGTAGERIGVHIGEIADTDDFRPWIRVWAPNGATLGAAFGTDAAALGDLIAPVTGTYLVLVASADSGFDGTGTYRLTMTKTPGPITVSAGDQGGPLTNGNTHAGAILQGDLDVWTFTAAAGQRIRVLINETTETDDFRPWIRVWAPNGATIGSAFGLTSAQIGGAAGIVAPVGGTYLVLVSSADSGFDGIGTYQLTPNITSP